MELCKARVGILQLDEEAMFRCAQDISLRKSLYLRDFIAVLIRCVTA